MSSMQRLVQADNRDMHANTFNYILIVSYENSAKQFALRFVYITTISEARNTNS